MHTLSDYWYELPEEKIAQELATPADSAKLLVYNRTTQTIQDRIFHELPWLLPKWSHVFFNTSKVVKARILIPEIDGEIFFLEQHTDPYTFDALVRPRKKMKVWAIIQFGIYSFELLSMTVQWRVIRCSHPILEVLEAVGQMPLPPYIAEHQSKADNYQPLQAIQPGSVAAPTASLHFTQDTFDELKKHWHVRHDVVLHIGIGTFKQVETEILEDYNIHSERAHVSLETFESIAALHSSNRPLVAIWTTVTRTLETLPYVWVCMQESNLLRSVCSASTFEYRDTLTQDITIDSAQKFVKSWNIEIKESIESTSSGKPMCTIYFESTLFIYPWFEWKVITHLLTNFHLPKSSLLILVAAMIGYDTMKSLYNHAIHSNYMFYSFGDAMLITR